MIEEKALHLDSKKLSECYCNMCGKQLDEWDIQEDYSADYRVGYGSKYDKCRIQIQLCCECFDKVMDWLRPQCRIEPIVGVVQYQNPQFNMTPEEEKRFLADWGIVRND